MIDKGRWIHELGKVKKDLGKLDRGFHLGGRPDIFGAEAEFYPRTNKG